VGYCTSLVRYYFEKAGYRSPELQCKVLYLLES